ncbi:MAG: hypothetical protein CSA65_01645 [Proteobacteria bacterium]|nr:MAG: hypothetical protein CSA65_01645 [Pseudomonadota bacterium]
MLGAVGQGVIKNPLAALFSLRERVRDEAERAVAGALAAEAEAGRRLDAEEQAVAAAQARLREALATASGGVADLLQRRERFAMRRRDELEAQRERRDEAARARSAASREVAARREALGKAQVALEIAGKAAERWDAEQLREAQRRAELELEELVSARAARTSR